jgi:HK97 family phage major capsid protein
MTINELNAKIKAGKATADEQREFYRLVSEIAGNAQVGRSNGRDLDTRGFNDNGARTAQDEQFTTYLRTGTVSPGMVETRAVSNSEGTQPGQIGGAGGTAGGYMVAQGFWRNLQVALKAYGGTSAFYKQLETDTGAIIPWPTLDPTAAVGTLLSEGNQLSVDGGTYVFGQGVLNAYTYTNSGAILISRQLINDAEFPVDEFIAERCGEQIGRAIAAHAISGTGSSQPLGINPAAVAKGSAGTVGGTVNPVGGFLNLATAASVKTFAAPAGATELVGNVLSPATCLAMVSAVDAAYWPNASWHLSPAQALNMRGVIDSNGRPLLDFATGMQDGAVGTILGFPVYTDANIPALTASTVGGPMFGDLSRAMVMRKVRDASVLRLSERYADFSAVGVIAYQRVDIRSNDMRAVVVTKPAAT